MVVMMVVVVVVFEINLNNLLFLGYTWPSLRQRAVYICTSSLTNSSHHPLYTYIHTAKEIEKRKIERMRKSRQSEWKDELR